jgi:hypothetical protein
LASWDVSQLGFVDEATIQVMGIPDRNIPEATEKKDYIWPSRTLLQLNQQAAAGPCVMRNALDEVATKLGQHRLRLAADVRKA